MQLLKSGNLTLTLLSNHGLYSNFANCHNNILYSAFFFPKSGSKPASHIACDGHVSLVSFNLDSYSAFLCFIIIFKGLVQLFCGMFLNCSLSAEKFMIAVRICTLGRNATNDYASEQKAPDTLAHYW